MANDARLLDGTGNSSWFVHVYAALQNVPRRGAIHCAGVDVGKAKPLCQRAGDAAFAGSRGTIDGDDMMSGHYGLRRFFIGNGAEASSWSTPLSWKSRDPDGVTFKASRLSSRAASEGPRPQSWDHPK